jgi:hypothetical protein
MFTGRARFWAANLLLALLAAPCGAAAAAIRKPSSPLIRLSIATWAEREAGPVLKAKSRSVHLRVSVLNLSGEYAGPVAVFSVFRYSSDRKFSDMGTLQTQLRGDEKVKEFEISDLPKGGSCELFGIVGDQNNPALGGVAQVNAVVILSALGARPACAHGKASPCGSRALPIGIGMLRHAFLLPQCNRRFSVYIHGKSALRLAEKLPTKRVEYGNLEVDISSLTGENLFIVPEDIFFEDRSADDQVSFLQ